MERTPKTITLIALVLMTVTSSVWASGTVYGAAAATTAIAEKTPFGITEMLRWAVEDEYLARGEYAAIMKKFGNIKPYSNIMAAEEQHLGWLKSEYETRKLPFPPDGSAPYVVVPATLKDAAQAGVDAEISNISMYKAFLARPETGKPENSGAKALFDKLMKASENHLQAFRTQLSKY